MEDSEFQSLLGACVEVADAFPDGVVYIGGIAVYMHAQNSQKTRPMAAFTHDADFYISLADMSDLRDQEEVTNNRLQTKHQMNKGGFVFDIYTERWSSLTVPYDAVLGNSVLYDQVRVACLEHLLVLKLEAFADRKGSAKGEKDAKDLLRIAAVAACDPGSFRPDLSAPYLRDVHTELLSAVERGPHAMSLAHGNAVTAKALRRDFAAMVAAVLSAGSDGQPSTPGGSRNRRG